MSVPHLTLDLCLGQLHFRLRVLLLDELENFFDHFLHAIRVERFPFRNLEESVGERLAVAVQSVQFRQIGSAAEYDRPGRVLDHVAIVKLKVVHKEIVQMSRRQYNDGDSGVSLGGVQQLLVPFQSNSHGR